MALYKYGRQTQVPNDASERFIQRNDGPLKKSQLVKSSMLQTLCFNCQQPIYSNAQFCPFCGQSQSVPALTGQLAASAILDNRYIIEGLIGKGGMGAVYRASDMRISGRICAIKEMSLLTLPVHERRQAVQNFTQEAQLLAQLEHPNLPKVHDFFQDGSSGSYYLVMDFVQGVTLEALLQQQGRPFSEQQVRAWGVQVCDVLRYLHDQTPPVIFRDLKPQNIMLDLNGHIKLIDFGIARFFKPTQSKDTQAMGTQGYAPPEQYGQGQTDARSDIYSLGATLWRLLTDQDPADDPYRLPGVRWHNPAISAELEAIIQHAMQLRPGDRFQTVVPFQQTLQGQPIGPIPVGSIPPRRKSYAWVMAAVLFLLLGSGAGILFTGIPTPTLQPTGTPTQQIVLALTATATNRVVAPTSTATATVTATSTPSATTSPTTPPPTPQQPLLPIVTATPTLQPSFIGSDGVEMVLVPAGEFIMGSTQNDVTTADALCRQSKTDCRASDFINEIPQHTVYVSSFYIDVTEITNDQYRACVNARVCMPPSDADTPDNRYQVGNYYDLSRYGNYPVVRIRWEDAHTYCEWVGERLPTEAEWEKAARGTDGRVYPWGNNFDSRKANTQESSGDQVKPIGSYPDGHSPYGVYDMAGNVWEYVADYYNETYYQNAPNLDPQGPASGSIHVLRGGSYSDYQEYARVANRGVPKAKDLRSGFRGFRCAQPAK